jgi:ABC-2 type transport system ATP-binding protein/lipopolysaccharide transport system ATP-binding protein
MNGAAPATEDRQVLRLEAVSVCYRLAKQRTWSFKDYAIHWMTRRLVYEQLWALRDVTLSLGRGEAVGLIGRNGAGKSTLLKVIARVLKPIRGQVQVHGRVAPLLELGTGFDYELTGLENVYLNALLLGHRRREVDAKLDEIVEFSGLGDFLRAPIRNYSTGMLARLGFAIATAWVPELLLVDEVLSVGDAAFARKCEQRMQQFRQAGTTLLLVSHHPESIRQNCTRCLWLDGGVLRADGPAAEVLERYAATLVEPRPPAASQAP